MSEFVALHNISLLLVGNNIQVSPSISSVSYDSSEKEVASVSDSSDDFPDDERLMDCLLTKKKSNTSQEETTGIEAVMQPEQEKDVLVLVDDETSGPDESRWRAYGLARRRKILEEDRKNGGRNFSLTFDCSVQRYFSVAHWALEQFHQLYQNISSNDDEHKLEEIYIMGFRIISFLTECLPQHPGFKRAPLIQERSKQELEHLRECLRAVALRIDEFVCNKFVEDGDMFLDTLISSEMEKEDADDEADAKTSRSSPAHDKVTVFESWVNFDEFNKMEQQNSEDARKENERKLTKSPTNETVGTSGSESGDAKSNTSNASNNEGSKYVRRIAYGENSTKEVGELEVEEVEENGLDNDDRVIREDIFEMDDITLMDDFSLMDESLKSYSSQPFTLLRKSVSLDFLKSIACEPVLYETDSDAADSWANNDTDPKSRPFVPSSSGVTPTSDPARIAFRNLMNKLPHNSILKRTNKHVIPEQKSEDVDDSSRPASPTFSDIMEERDTLKISSLDEQSLDEVVDNEIEHYLDKKLGKLDQKLSSWNKKLGKLDKKLNQNSGHKSRRSRSSRSSRRSDRGSNASTSYDASSYSSSSVSASVSSRRSRRLRSDDRHLKPSTSYDDSSYSSSSASGVYPDLRTNRDSRRHDQKLKSFMSTDVSTHSSSSSSTLESHQDSRASSLSRRNTRKNRKSVSFSDESSSSSSSTSSAGLEVRSRRAPRREAKKYAASSDTSTSSVETPSSSYTSLKYLRKQEGSENSAFISVGKKSKKRSQRKRRREKSEAPKVQDDWISFDNFTGSNYFGNAFK